MPTGVKLKKLPRPNIFILHLGDSADKEMRDGAVVKFGNVKDLTRILVVSRA